ncbi:MAG TPA: GYD domain-containing protein [Acidimicrobiales bacterium]|nr:GYD domain-containing protein [Acidimicrobiales bacterium]
MGKYLAKANYVGDGVNGLMQEGGTKRRDAAAAAIESVGGSLESFYYAFGDADVYGIAEFPDDASATAFSLLVNSTGAVSITLTPLMTAEDLDAAAAKTPSYRPPGG